MDDCVERHNEVGGRREHLGTRRDRDRLVQVRKGAIGPPTNFQHVAHGFSSRAIPEVAEDGRLHQHTTTTSSNQRETSDSKSGNLSRKSVEGEEDPLWDNQEWYTCNGDGGRWENQSCCIPDDGRREEYRRTVSHPRHLPNPQPLTSEDSDHNQRPYSLELRKDMIGPPTNFQHVFHVDKNSGRELRLIGEVSISRPAILHPKPQESLREGLQEDGHHDTPADTPPSPRASGPSAAGVRNEMIGPPTNFQHVKHVEFSGGSSLQVIKDQQLRDPTEAISWEAEELSDCKSYKFRRAVPAGEGSKHKSRWQTHRWSSPIGDLDLQEAQLGSQRWPSLDEDCSYQPVTQTPGSWSSMKQREGLLEARRQQQRTGRQALRTSKSSVQPPPGWVRVIPGSPTDRLGFIKDMTWQVSEDQEPSRACYVDGQRESDSKIEDKKYDLPDTDRGQQEAQWENPRWPGSDDAGNHDPQWENPRWLGPNDAGNHEEACSGDHLWRRPHTTRPLSPAAPGRLRKDSIGPPTNFHHVLHIDRHSTEHELQQLMANLNKEEAPSLKTHKSLPDLVEHGGNKDTGHRITDLPWPTGASVPPAGIRKDMIGQPTNFQHVTHVGFGDKRSAGISEELQQQQDPTTSFSLPKLTCWNGHYLSDPETQSCTSDGMSEHGGQQTHLKSQPWSYHDGDCPEEEDHRQDHQYSIPGVDGGQQVAQETHQWSIPHLEDDPSSSLAQTPSWLRKDMIGPPTNFQHIFHLDRDNIDQEIQQMLREVGVDLQPLSDSKTQRVANDVTERQRGQEESSGRSTTLRDLPDPAKPGRIRKDMIGPPTNFQHVSHVGLSSTTAWQVTED